tara:strand:+ start:90 stop:866 length:777 start_codon:yes stop_codon:yes gene_type:complete
MASGQILNILSKLGKGIEKTEGRERTSKRKEGRQHKKMFLDMNKIFGTAKRKGEKSKGFANMLSTAIALTGVGLPYALAANLALKTAGGYAGRLKSQEFLKGVKGFKGTKFSGDLEQYEKDVGKDFFQDALTDTAMQAVTAGTMKGLQDKMAMPEAFKKLIPEKILGAKEGKGLKSILSAKTPLGQLASGKPLEIAGKSIGIEGNTLTNIANTLHTEGGNTMLQQLATEGMQAERRKKQPSIYEYKIPEQMASPYFRG